MESPDARLHSRGPAYIKTLLLASLLHNECSVRELAERIGFTERYLHKIKAFECRKVPYSIQYILEQTIPHERVAQLRSAPRRT